MEDFLFSYYCLFFSSRRRHTRCALVTGVQRVLFRSVDLDEIGTQRRGDVEIGLACALRGPDFEYDGDHGGLPGWSFILHAPAAPRKARSAERPGGPASDSTGRSRGSPDH